MNCEKSQHSHIQNKRTSKEAWGALKKVHGVQAKGRINLLLKQFLTYKACPDESIDDVASALENIKVKIGDINKDRKPPDSLIAIALMSAIKDPAYNTVNFMLEREPNLTLKSQKNNSKGCNKNSKTRWKTKSITHIQRIGRIAKNHHRSATTAVKLDTSASTVGTGLTQPMKARSGNVPIQTKSKKASPGPNQNHQINLTQTHHGMSNPLRLIPPAL